MGSVGDVFTPKLPLNIFFCEYEMRWSCPSALGKLIGGDGDRRTALGQVHGGDLEPLRAQVRLPDEAESIKIDVSTVCYRVRFQREQ